MNATEEKPQQINDLEKSASSVRDDSGVNGSGTGSKSGTPLTQPRSGPVRAPRGPHVYFVRAENAVKIGFSEQVVQRLAGLQTGHAVDLELLGTVPGSEETERGYHERFAHLRMRGEWFRAEQELLDAIDADCQSAVVPNRAIDYAEIYKNFDRETKNFAEPGNELIYARTQVLGRLGQLAENKHAPADIRDWHFGIHSEGLKEAMEIFERAKARLA